MSMLVSTSVYKDYRTGLSKRLGRIPESSWMPFRRQFKRSIDGKNRIYFSVAPVPTRGVLTGRWKGDRSDRQFFALLAAARRSSEWDDKQIIFASRDS